MQELLCSQDVLRLTHRATPPTCVSNDTAHEMIHVGWSNGGLSVYRPFISDEVSDLIHWTCFPAHQSPVFQTMGSYGTGIYSISTKAFKLHSHGGMEIFSQEVPTSDSFTCFSPLSIVHVLCGTKSGAVYEVDLQYGKLLQSPAFHDSPRQEISKLHVTERSSVIIGTGSGTVNVLDLRQRRQVAEFKATTGGKIFDMDVSGDLAVTAGYSSKGLAEPFVRVFDLRTNRQIAPIQFLAPAGVRFVPNSYMPGVSSSSILLVSANGNIRMTDAHGATSAGTDSFGRVQNGGGNIESLAVSCTGQSFSMVDTAGHIHFWSTSITSGWNICDPQVLQSQPSLELEHPLPASRIPTSISSPSFWSSDETPLSYVFPSIPEVPLLSDFPEILLEKPVRNSKASIRIQPTLLNKVVQRDHIGYLLNSTNLPGMKLLFGTEHHHEAYVDVDPRASAINNRVQETSIVEDEKNQEEIMKIKKRYSRQTSNVTQVTVSEHDFSEVNETQFAGLEIDPNSFVNAPLQLLYFIPEFRSFVLAVPFSTKQVCIPTEMGLLFRMLDKCRLVPSQQKSCQARNFHRALRLSPDALALGLLEPSKLINDRRAGAFLRLVFSQFSAFGGTAKDAVDTLFATKFSHRDAWEGKKQVTVRESTAYILDVVEEEKTANFETAIGAALTQEKRHKVWNEQQKNQVNVTSIKVPLTTPHYLVFNCAELLPRESGFSADYFCKSFAFSVEKSQVVGTREDDNPPGNLDIFDVIAVVSRITDFSKSRKNNAADSENNLDGHLVLHTRLLSSYEQNDDQKLGKFVPIDSWLLFNDVSVSMSSCKEALDFWSKYRAPALIIYKKRCVREISIPLPYQVASDVFLTPAISAASRKQQRNASTSLQVPTVNAGDLVAIDCEFVALSNDVYELNPDGSKVIIAPRELALARVSCLSKDGHVIMDDFVATGPEPVVDYLTRFSGLVQGDLDPAVSTKHLLPLRTVYLKLLYLIERGCIFVGHGLDSDFRVINVVVTPNQVRDTVQLFWTKGQRMLSLRFLSSFLLQEEIQDRIHDSIQDATAALNLYLKYLELVSTGKLDETLKRIYLEGPVRNWS